MNKPAYVCSKCPRAFRRRWNAKRHYDTIHKGLSNINTKYEYGKKINAIKNQPGFNPYFASATASKSKYFKYLQQKNSNDFSSKPVNNVGSPLKVWNRPVMPMDEGEKEDFLYNSLEKMAIPFEQLEKLFFEKLYFFKPSEYVEKKLSVIIITALESPDPVKFLNAKLDHYTRQFYSNRMIAYVAKSGNTDIFTAVDYLKSKLADTYTRINL